MTKIAIVGGGINGLACAVKIKNKYPNFDVVVISEKFSPDTTGDGSGGLWYPYLCGITPTHLITKWGSATYAFLHKLWLEGGHGISLMPIYYLHTKKDKFQRPAWTETVFGYHELEQKQLNYFSELYSGIYTAGETFTTFVVFPPLIIAYLQKRFLDMGGNLVQARISSLQDPMLIEYDIIVNCTGLGARYMVPDTTIFAIRGQIAKVSAPWICQTVMDKEHTTYIIPNPEDCVLGGTSQDGNYNLQVDEKDSNSIFDKCYTIIPSLQSAKLLYQWVGLRPGRHEVRLEAEHRGDKLFIHNYGHGGSGLTLFWGCATDVLNLLEKKLNNRTQEKSKL